MKKVSIWIVLIGFALGIGIGYFLHDRSPRRASGGGSEILSGLSYSEFIARTGSFDWTVIKDEIDERFPPLSRNPRVARWIVAETSIEASEQSAFVSSFQSAAEDWIHSRGGMIKGHSSVNRAMTETGENGAEHRQVSLPRRYYAIDDVHGVADFWCLADSGRVTVMISLIEGR